MQLSSRRSRSRIDCALLHVDVDGAAFPVALLGLILSPSMIACEDAKADVGMSQAAQKMTPPRVDDAIQSHVAEASRRFRIPAAWIWAVMQAESAGDVRARSKKGAMGLMQIMPATGASLKVGDISLTESNIHAGAKYMDQLMTRYFKDAKYDDSNRAHFAIASYNAGPGNIAKMRKEADKRGLNPDKLFNHVEVITAEKIGTETTTYVRNIFKYYTAYRLGLEVREEQRQAREAVKPGN